MDKNNLIKISYKILNDALFLLLVTFGLSLIVDGILPGFISPYLSFTKLVIFTLFIAGLIIFLGKKYHWLYSNFHNIRKSKLVFIMTTFSFILIGNSLLKFSLLENTIIVLAGLSIFYLFYKTAVSFD